MKPQQMNHREYIDKTRTMDMDALLYTIRDCQNALKAMPHNPKAGYYADEICYCTMEINRRRTAQRKAHEASFNAKYDRILAKQRTAKVVCKHPPL